MNSRKYETSDIYLTFGDEVVGVIKRRKTILNSGNSGVIVKDGRPVRKVGGKWEYSLMDGDCS